MPLSLIERQELADELHISVMCIEVLHENLLTDYITDSSHVRDLMDCFVTLLMNELTNFSCILLVILS